MDVIADAGPIRRVVIPTKHRQALPAPHAHLRDERHQVVGNPLRVFANPARGMAPHRVKVP